MFKRKHAVSLQMEELAVLAQKHEANSEVITQELYRKNVELAHTNRTLSLLRTIDTLVLASDSSIETLVQGIADAIIANTPHLFCGLFVREENELMFPIVGYKTGHGIGLTALEKQNVLDLKIIPGKKWVQKNVATQLFDAQSEIAEEKLGEFISSVATIEHLLEKTAAQTLCLIKLMSSQKVVGLMMLGLSENKHKMRITDLEHIGRLADAIGIALDNKLLNEENKRVLKKLRSTNIKLKALDEAKDEFISMASHQLRTPLTSVKGYLSMLAEGDAGEMNDNQKQFVNQAFISSQRMVYLIADLLNVSRLRTGKFVIEAAPTYLPDVVETEIAQLEETVKSRGLTMHFDKPSSFSTLMLDETKIRQVIMNFTDNAIYYTPSGGTITVALKETDKSVEFTVTDTGLGVPKADQPHLFTKFYRAGNARKARPDGTGLGLFMAKKVVIAQGGSIIFKSTEGKGSTFGFNFPKEQLLAQANK